jgi:hypothetical protein
MCQHLLHVCCPDTQRLPAVCAHQCILAGGLSAPGGICPMHVLCATRLWAVWTTEQGVAQFSERLWAGSELAVDVVPLRLRCCLSGFRGVESPVVGFCVP